MQSFKSTISPAATSTSKLLLPRNVNASTQVLSGPTLLKPYSPIKYNLLPTLNQARSVFDQRNRRHLVKNDLRTLFRKHSVEDKLGVGLVHRHFDLRPEERLVEYNGTSTPWQCRDCFLGRKIVPIAWQLDAEGMFPYEFRFSTTSEDAKEVLDLQRQSNFLGAFNDILRSHGLSSVIGLCPMPAEGVQSSLEVTHGRANINIPRSELREKEWNDETTETMWFFDTMSNATYACKCSNVMESHRHY